MTLANPSWEARPDWLCILTGDCDGHVIDKVDRDKDYALANQRKKKSKEAKE